jgi:small subunit ribosomal protein S5
MTTDPKEKNNKPARDAGAAGKSVYAKKKARARKDSRPKRDAKEEFEQRIVDIARVTRVMAGGKRMRFRACVVIGDKKGKVGAGLAKGSDVTMAVTKAVNKAKKEMVDVPIVNDTIPHQIEHKYGAAKVVLKPARSGRGVIAGGVMRIILDMAGIQNVTCKNLGTNNKVNITKCTVRALSELKKVEGPGKTRFGKKNNENKKSPEAKNKNEEKPDDKKKSGIAKSEGKQVKVEAKEKTKK